MRGISVVKNSVGVSCVTSAKICHPEKIGQFGGSSLNRGSKTSALKKLLRDPILEEKQKLEKRSESKSRSMSGRTKVKIRKKVIAFSMVCPKLTFLTLTFCNKVEDKEGIKIFRAFLDNAKNRLPDLEYIWIIERQENNKVFKDNVHFHLITNKFWKIDKWWNYWLDTQARFGILPRDKEAKPGSAFDIRKINSNNIKGIMNYMTKYVVKNKSKFQCQVWNCSKRISRLYTDFYSDLTIISYLEQLEKKNLLGGNLLRIKKDFCNLFLIPLNQTTMRLYEKLKQKNLEVWNNKDQEVSHV